MKSWNEMSKKEQLAASHYDFYKSVFGVRPRWMNYDDMSEQDLEKAMEELAVQAEVQEKADAERERKAISGFEVRVMDSMNVLGAKSRKQAIEWIRQAEGCENQDDDYFCFVMGLPYGYVKESE